MALLSINDFESVSSFFKGTKGKRRAELIMRMCAVDQLNQTYDRSGAYRGTAFTSRFLDDLGVNYVIGNPERLNLLPEGAFITVSNHPYGMLDGIMMIDLMAGLRPDYKFMVNMVLSRVKTMEENFIMVTPTGNEYSGATRTSLRGIRETLTLLQEGHPVGFFPSGAVSDFSLKDFHIRDRKWQSRVLRLIHAARVPILPIRFFDGNSPFYYFLGVINWRIRLLKLPSELFNKRNQTNRIGIGSIVSVQEQEKFPDAETLGIFLRKAVYEMPRPESFVPRSALPGWRLKPIQIVSV